MKVAILRIGNSQGVLIPKPLLTQVGLGSEVELTVENDAIVLRKPSGIRNGWAKESQAIARHGDDALVWPEFGTADDAELQW